jgi:hypothetical protein
MRIEGFFVGANVAQTAETNNYDEDERTGVSDFSVGDRVEILIHLNSEYKGRLGKISVIGAGMMQGTNPLDYNIDIPNQEKRFIITLDDNAILNDIQSFQLRKI